MYSSGLHVLKIACRLTCLYRMQWFFNCLLADIFLYFALLIYIYLKESAHLKAKPMNNELKEML